jgi:hypothetical protein
MSSSFGRLFTVTTWGESHGPAVGVVVDGVPAGLPLDMELVQKDLDRRRPGQSSITTQRSEADTAVLLSGVFEGRTTGTPIALLAWNQDAKSKDYDTLKDVFRPGHADFTYAQKYGHRDHRGRPRLGPRDARPSPPRDRQAAGDRGVSIVGGTVQVADVTAVKRDWAVAESNAIRCPDPEAALQMIARIEAARAEHDSVGGVVEVVARGCPAGWGDPTMEKLDGEIARALMSIPALKVSRSATASRPRSSRPPVERRDGSRGFPHEPRGRHPGRHLDRRRHRGARGGQAGELDRQAARDRQRGGRGRDHRGRGPPRPLHLPASRAGGTALRSARSCCGWTRATCGSTRPASSASGKAAAKA